MIDRLRLPYLAMLCLLLFSPLSGFADHDPKRESCRVCGMHIDEYLRSSAELIFPDGTTRHTCGVACMLREVEDAGGLSAFRSVKVHDWKTGHLVDAETAFYVVGSDLIPDMLPNYIAFETEEEARKFAQEKGGTVIPFAAAFEDSSPRGNTAPFRIRTAVTPGQGGLAAAVVYGYMQKDQVKIGESGRDPNDFITRNRAQPRSPNEVQVHVQSLALNYSVTNDLAVFLNVPWFEKRLKTLAKNPATGQVSGQIGDKNGLGDLNMEFRYNLWRDDYFAKWLTLFAGLSLPTGEFDGTRTRDSLTGRSVIATPTALQLGTGQVGITPGILYSQRWHDFWFHGNLLYRISPENDDRYKFGDQAVAGIALHYTPNYDLMLGIEMDAVYAEQNADRGFKVANSGGTTSNLAVVFDWRFLNALGGNFTLRGSAGLPIYEDLNYKQINGPRGSFQQVQLGEGFFTNLAINWQTRIAPEYPTY